MIELLIVVAIIGILTAVAVPNFLEAQTRAKVARVRSDQRTLAIAIEVYYLDNNDYMPYNDWGSHGDPDYLNALSTPIAYVTSSMDFNDPFYDPEIHGFPPFAHYGYYAATLKSNGQINQPWREIAANLEFFGVSGGNQYRYCFTSAGPNRILEIDDWKALFFPLFYDGSNGTISSGDILRFGP